MIICWQNTKAIKKTQDKVDYDMLYSKTDQKIVYKDNTYSQIHQSKHLFLSNTYQIHIQISHNIELYC
jgi:hypothetical protein